MKDEQKIKEYLRQKLQPLEDDDFTSEIVKNYLATLRTKKVAPVSTQMMVCILLTVVFCVMSLSLHLTSSEVVNFSGVTLNLFHFLIISTICALFLVYRFLLDRMFSKRISSPH